MSATAVKATNRTIRKAFGAEAVEIINKQAEAIATNYAKGLELEKAIGQERSHRLELAAEQRRYVDSSDRILAGSISVLERKINRGFFGRLFWLVTGR